MAWTNSNWITYTGTARLTAVRALIVEVQDAITAGVSSDGTRYDPANLGLFLDSLMKVERDLAENLNGGVFAVPTRRRI
jgi:hypothetical protein